MCIGYTPRRQVRWATFTVLAIAWVAGPAPVEAQEQYPFEDSPFLRLDPEKVVLDERDSRVPCGECHVDEYEVWLGTKHAEGFNTLHRTELAQDILRDMGLRTAKRQESLCLRCHYTVKAPSLKAIAGVACESCHGAAREWLDIHNDWGPGIEHPDNEDPTHRQRRIQESVVGGMLRPSADLYAVAANCFECHTVPMEELVNVGGHPAGSSDFELTERIAQIRHNFVAAQWGGSRENREPTIERTRMTYVLGRILDYEYGIRAMARATHEDRYSRAIERRIIKAARALETIARAADIPQIKEILAAGREARFVPNNRDALLTLAGRTRTLAGSFAGAHDGSQLASLDDVIVGRGPVAAAPVPESEEPGPEDSEPAVADGGGEASSVPRTSLDPTEAGRAGVEPAGPSVVGAVRNRPAWFPDPDPRYQTTQEAEECVSCHAVAEEWWYQDPHEASALKLLNRDPQAVQIASLYGLSEHEMTLGSRICMNCHGTIESAAPNVQVWMGVSCESCHGPSSEYLEPHEDGGNPQLGMVPLKDLEARAANCARCHHMTDERLLSSGHPSGSEYDFVAANEKIEHWPDDRRVGRRREDRGDGPYPEVSDEELAAAFQAEISTRPIPDVPVATPPSTRPRRAAASSTATGDAGGSGRAAAARTRRPRTVRERAPVRTTGGERVAAPPWPPARRPSGRAPRRSSPPASNRSLEPLSPASNENTTEEILLMVKRRLEQLYRSLHRGN